MNIKRIYCDITKKDDEERIVSGYATTEKLDSQGEIVKSSAVAEALPGYLGDVDPNTGRFRYGNIREMHQFSAVGKTLSASIDDTKKGLYIEAKVVDDAAWKKVKEGVYTAFSIGGEVTKRIGNIISGLKLSEISLVDRPANDDATYDTIKMFGLAKMADGKLIATQDELLEKKKLNAADRKKISDENFAYIDSKGGKHLPIEDANHCRNALARFDQTKFESDEAKAKAKAKILARCKELGIETSEKLYIVSAKAGLFKAADLEISDLDGDYDRDDPIQLLGIWNADSLLDICRQLTWMISSTAEMGIETSHLVDVIEAAKAAAMTELDRETKKVSKKMAAAEFKKAQQIQDLHKTADKIIKARNFNEHWTNDYFTQMRKAI